MTALVNTMTGEIVGTCTPDEAREITDRIKGAVESAWRLLLEAHDRCAWSALGYGSWRDYAQTEFGIGQSRAYQLLDQARVVREIEAASGSTKVEITEREARDLKPHLEEVKADIAQAVAALPDPTPEAVAETVRVSVSRKREQVRAKPTEPSVADVIDEARNSPSHKGGQAVEQLHAIRKFIESLGGPSRIVADLDGESGRQLAELWLPTIDATCDVLDDWRQRLRRRHLKGVK